MSAENNHTDEISPMKRSIKDKEGENQDLNVKKDGQVQKMRKIKMSNSLNQQVAKAHIANAIECIYFKIINSKEEFHAFEGLNLEHSFHPLFCNQIFGEEEKITGYKNLKILISLTPKSLFPHIKIVYDSCLEVKDDLDLLFEKYYEHVYETSEEKFLEKLEADLKVDNIPPKGELIKSANNLQIHFYDILKENALVENFNYQCILTFFIDGASFIPIENNFWHYYTLHEKTEEGVYKLLGFCSVVHFHVNLYDYRAMVSQFFILPVFQRRGYGNLLLENIYDNYTNKPHCKEITTEDPGSEFILLRDITLFKKMLKIGKFDEFITILPVKTLEEYKKIHYTPEELSTISSEFKITVNLVNRCLSIFKYVNINNNPVLYKHYRKEIKLEVYKMNRADFEADSLLTDKRRRGPHIYFHDEPEFKLDLSELGLLNCTEQTKFEKLELYFNEIEADFNQIASKCVKLINDYRNNNLK